MLQIDVGYMMKQNWKRTLQGALLGAATSNGRMWLYINGYIVLAIRYPYWSRLRALPYEMSKIPKYVMMGIN